MNIVKDPDRSGLPRRARKRARTGKVPPPGLNPMLATAQGPLNLCMPGLGTARPRRTGRSGHNHTCPVQGSVLHSVLEAESTNQVVPAQLGIALPCCRGWASLALFYACYWAEARASSTCVARASQATCCLVCWHRLHKSPTTSTRMAIKKSFVARK